MYSPVLKAGVDRDLCLGCGQCVKVCPVGAIDLEEKATIDQGKCITCGSCLQVCPPGAIRWTLSPATKPAKVDDLKLQALKGEVSSLSNRVEKILGQINQLK